MDNMSKEIFEMIHGYQKSSLLFYINTLPEEEKIIWLRKMFKGYENDIMMLHRYLNYHAFNYGIWGDIRQCMKGIPRIKSHDDLPIKDYVLGLTQRNRLAWRGVNMFDHFGFVTNKTVLDFGCGGGFYTDILSTMASCIYYTDKPEVLEVLDGIVNFTKNCVKIDDLKSFNGKFDIIFLSEVIHGKGMAEIEDLLELLDQYLVEDTGMIVINELNPNTPLGELFNIQMKIHTKNGRLYKIDETLELFNEIEVVQISPYHYTIGGTR